jgi:myo-inositol-1(or 4)-monophosphatase
VLDQKNVRKVLRVSVRSARRAGRYLMKRFERGDSRIHFQSSHDVKLDVDVEAERIIMSTIKEEFPEHGFVCEESGYSEVSDNYWVIDPLDGTVNFSKGIPHFCTSIAFRSEERTLVGAVLDPVRGELFAGMFGGEATLNRCPINRENISNLEDAVVVGGFFKAQSLEYGKKVFENISRNVQKIRFFGSAALDLCYLACGRVNGYIQYSVHDWDIAAASFIAELSGVRLEVEVSGHGLNVIGADRAIFESLRALI